MNRRGCTYDEANIVYLEKELGTTYDKAAMVYPLLMPLEDMKDILLIMSQSDATMEAAIAAYKKNRKDIVCAIMDLTM